MEKVIGNFGLTGWSESVEDKAKSLMVNYRCSNNNQSIMYTGIKTLGGAFNQANHDPELLAKTIGKDLTSLFGEVYDRAVITSESIMNDNNTYDVEISIVITEKGEKYELHSILKSNGKDLFDEYDKTYYDFKF